MPETPSAAPGSVQQSKRFVVSDIHGHPKKFLAALHRHGLVDQRGRWAGGQAALWVLGDYFDRGPDGVGVVDLLIRLTAEASDAGGQVTALLGNHEVLTLGKKRFDARPIDTPQGTRSFANSWQRNNGRPADQRKLSDRQLDWLAERPAIALAGDQLLLHSDIVGYRHWGDAPEQVNQRVRAVLQSSDPTELWQLWADLTKRGDFRGPEGTQNAETLLSHFDARHIFHGHSIIGEDEGKPAAEIAGPENYAGGLVTAIDGGLFAGGPCLIVEF